MIGIGMKRFAMRMWVCLLVAFAIGAAALEQTPSPNEKKTISMRSGTLTFSQTNRKLRV
jgi:hypothetical protein